MLKETNIGKTKATLTFEAQDFAKEYILGYKKSGDAEYKFIDSPTPEITIKPLEVNTTYFIKAYCKSGEYESPAFYYEFKTGSVDYTYPLDINNLGRIPRVECQQVQNTPLQDRKSISRRTLTLPALLLSSS